MRINSIDAHFLFAFPKNSVSLRQTAIVDFSTRWLVTQEDFIQGEMNAHPDVLETPFVHGAM
jgi:hypothetical protein